MKLVRIISSLWIVFALSACDGRIRDPGENDNDSDADSAADASRFHRLTHDQWDNTVRDLFYLDDVVGLATQFQPDPPLGRFDNNIARLSVTAGHWQDYQRAAEQVAEIVANDPVILDAIVPADLPADLGAGARAFLEHFGARAFRRPMTPEEVDAHAAAFLGGSAHYPEHDDLTAGIRLSIETMLQSPHFLYRVEDSTVEVDGAIQLDGYEVANRMAYAFWNTMPDDALLAAAASGALDTEQGVRDWALQMFDHPHTSAQFAHFHFQAFELRDYADLDKDTSRFPQWRRELGADMQTEMALFLGGEVFGGGGIRELLTSTRAYVTADLAALYGIEGTFDDRFQEVELDPSQRAGFLTRLGYLARNATLTEPDPIHRGVFVNLNLICRPISAVPNIPDDLNPVGDTNRERIDSITGFGTCGESCHGTIINPIGFSLENYDAIGRYRTEDNGFPVDAADTYVFEDGREISFDNALELSSLLADSPEVHACYLQQLLEYLYGRNLTEADARTIDRFATESVEQGLSVREVVLRVVTSQTFRFRPLEGVSP